MANLKITELQALAGVSVDDSDVLAIVDLSALPVETKKITIADMKEALGVGVYTYIKDVKATGTQGGTFTSGAWETRDLNTLTGSSAFASISSNQVTLANGVYQIYSAAPCYSVDGNQARFQNISDAVTEIVGTSEFSSSSRLPPQKSIIDDTLTVVGTKIFEVQHKGTTTQVTNGFGIASNSGLDEVYTLLRIIKVE